MLKKIAHNSTIPALGGNRDLKALQNLIVAEKAVLISLQKLSVDYSKASEALRTWGLTEGDYLGGILSASTSLLNHFSSALSQYAAHGHSMRDQLKAIRTREEALDDLERRRRSILRKAEDADKKLNKMSPDSKYFTMQTDSLNRLRDDIQTMDSDIKTEEAALDKFKRSATKVWMGLKFGGLVECCQKGTIAGEFGRLTIAEISEEMTQPGLPRRFTFPQNKIEDFVAEAYRCVNMITLSTFPSADLRDRGQHDSTISDAPPAAFYISVPTESFNNESRRVSAEPHQTSTTNNGDGDGYSPQGSSLFQSQTLPSSQQLGVYEGVIDNVLSTRPQYQPSQRSSLPQTLPSSQQLEVNEGALDDFGVNFRSSPPYQHQFHSIGSPNPQQSSQGTVNPSFSQTLPSSQHLRVNDDISANVRSTSPSYHQQQQFSQGTYNPSFSQTLPLSQQHQVNEDDFGHGANTPSTAPPYQQQSSHGTTNPSFSQTLPSSRQLGANEGVDDFGVNTHSTGLPYQQRFSQGSSNSSFSGSFSPSQQIRVNEGTSDNFGRNVRLAPALAPAPPYEQHFSQTLPRSQQVRVNESAADDNEGDIENVRSTGPQYQQQLSQTLPSSQQLGVNEGAVDDFGVNFRSTGPPHQQQSRSIGSPHPQQSSQGTVNPSFSQTLPSSQHLRVNDDTSANVRSTSPSYQQQFSQGTYNPSLSETSPPSQQRQVNEDGLGANAPSTAPPYQQQFSQGTTNPSFSQTLPSSRQLGSNEGVDDFGVNTHSTGPPYQQRFTQGNSNSSFSQTLPPSQQIRVNEGTSDNFGHNVRPAAPPYEQQQFSQGSVNASFSQTSPPYRQQQGINDISPDVHSPHPQRILQGIVNSSFSQTLPPSQQPRVNEGAVGPNSRPARSPHPQQFSHGFVPPSQQIRANEAAVDNLGSNVRPTTHPQQRSVSPLFSRRSLPSQQPRVNEDNSGANVRSTGSPHSQQSSQGTVSPSFSRALSPYQQVREGALDNSGPIVRSAGPADSSSTAGGQIATFQVQTRPAGSTGGYSLQDLPSTSDSSFSASVANALQENFDDPPGTKISPWVNNQLYDNSEGTTRRSYNQPVNAGSGRSDSPLPATAPSHKRQSPSGLVNQWTNLGGSSARSSLSTQSSDYHGSLIAPLRVEPKNMPPKTAVPFSVPPATTTTTTTATATALSAQNANDESNRHVRFGGVEDVDREIERRVSLDEEQRAIESPLFQNSSSSIANTLPLQFQTSQVSAPGRF